MTTEKQRNRRIRTPIVLAALLCLAIGSASNAGAVAFVNGSFETGDTTGWTTDSSYGVYYSSVGYGDGGGDGGVDFDGAYWAFIYRSDSGNFVHAYYEQTVTGLTAGTPYAVDFLMASEYNITSDSLFVSATGGGSTLLFTAPPDASVSGSSNGAGPFCCWDTWVSKEYLFTPTGTSSTIRFSTYGTESFNQYPPGFDKVSIREVISAVPEPTSLLLLGFGLAGLAAWRRKHAA